MTFDEFNEIKWTGGMLAVYCGNEYPIVSVDFEETLIALEGVIQGSDDPNWVRCENIEIVNT